jgi:hypothetical protein
MANMFFVPLATGLSQVWERKLFGCTHFVFVNTVESNDGLNTELYYRYFGSFSPS